MSSHARRWGQPCKVPLRNLSYVTGSVHRDLHELFTLLCAETERRGYSIRRSWSWGFACRYIAGTSKWSTHAYGIAVDINAPTNPHRRPLTTDMPGWMPRLWESYGFTWGGRWSTPDAMHYEANGTPAEMRRHLERARRELRPKERTWLEMATEADVRRVVREELARVTGGRNIPRDLQTIRTSLRKIAHEAGVPVEHDNAIPDRVEA